jgi:hypothetical protein
LPRGSRHGRSGRVAICSGLVLCVPHCLVAITYVCGWPAAPPRGPGRRC